MISLSGMINDLAVTQNKHETHCVFTSQLFIYQIWVIIRLVIYSYTRFFNLYPVPTSLFKKTRIILKSCISRIEKIDDEAQRFSGFSIPEISIGHCDFSMVLLKPHHHLLLLLLIIIIIMLSRSTFQRACAQK